MELLKYFKKLKWEFLLVVFLIVVNAGFLTLAGISSANALVRLLNYVPLNSLCGLQ